MAAFAPGTGAGLAEVARLITELELKDELTPGLQKASGQAAAYGAATDKAAVKTSNLGRVSKGAGNAMHHFGGRVASVTQLLGAGGLLGGVLGVTLALKNGVGMAEQWGRTTDRLRQLTGASVEESSRFADAYDKLGISQDKQIRIMGFLSKTLGNWNINRKQARQIEKDYGFDLIDTNGKMKNALKITQDFTAYFNNKHIPSYQKASLGAKLFGRGWTDMIPVFEKGPKAMQRAMKEAMAMAPEQLKDLHKWRDAQRELNDEVGDLQVKLGLAAIPALTELSHGITDFVSKNERKIRLFFGQGLEVAKEFAGFVANDVAPTLVNLAQGAVGFWNSIPGPLRDILLKGFVADRAIKFAFGFSITGLATDAIKDAIGGGLSRVFGRGSSPATPMYVKPVGVGGLGGGAGVGSSGMGRVGKGLLAIEGIAIVGAVASTVNDFMNERSAEQAELADRAKGLLGDTRDKAMTDIENMTRLMLKEADPATKAGIQTFASKELGTALLNAAKVLREETVRKEDIPAAIAKMSEAQRAATEYGWTQVAADIGKEMKELQEGRGGQSAETGSSKRTNKLLVEHIGVSRAVRDAYRRGQRTQDKGLQRAAELLKDGIMGDKDNAGKVKQAIKILEREQKQATERGATRMARNIGRDITALKRATQSGLGSATQKLGTIAAKPPPVVNVTTNVTAQVGIRDVERATTVVNRYGRGPIAV